MPSNINFDFSKITKNRHKPSIYQKLPKMTFRWPLRQKLTFFRQTNIFFWFLDPKNPLKHVLFMNSFFFVFFIILTILHIFSTLWAENAPTDSWWQLDMNFVPYDLPKKHLKQNYPGGEVRVPGSWTIKTDSLHDRRREVIARTGNATHY